MKKKFIVIVMITACFISGCSLVDQFQQAKDDYLETRVVELLDELPAEEPVVVEEVVEEPVVETEEVILEETQPVEEESDTEEKSADDAEVTEEVEETEEPTEADLAPEATEDPQAEATVESDDPAVYLGDADWTDEMDTAEFWQPGSDDYTAAAFENGKLKITALSDTDGWRMALQPVLKNVYMETEFTMKNCANKDEFGLYFRVPEKIDFNQGYKFGITCDGLYGIRNWDGLSKKTSWLQYYKVSESINKGKDQSNRIGVMALDDRLLMFVNGEKVGEVSDNAYTEGFFGLFINRDKTENLNILVDTVSYWTDPQEK